MEIIKSEYLVLGHGVAGLTFALKIADTGHVNVITKAKGIESNTAWAQGGIAAVHLPEDSPEIHKKDTLIAGAGLCHEDAVDVLVKEGPDRIQDLIKQGVGFDRKEERYSLAREGGHSYSRIFHVADLTGKAVEQVLYERALAHPNITIYEEHAAVELITEHHALGNLRADFNICFGAYVLDTHSGHVRTFQSDFTILATGGASGVYLHTTNPTSATGDGIAMAHRAGVRIANMEFVQFHPTSLFHAKKSFLISEALRGHGGKLINSKGENFMHKYDDRLELAPRDIVARAIDTEIKRLRDECVYLDMTHLPKQEVKERFPNIYQYCKENINLDITTAPIPVVPAAHYSCGGVMTNLHGLTSMQNLYAIGEAAHTGVHGANRLASNSLLEGLVFGHRAAEKILSKVHKKERSFDHIVIPEWDESGLENEEEWVLIKHNFKQLHQTMWDYVGIVRSKPHLNRAFRRLRLLYEEVEDYYKRTKVTKELIELRNSTAVGHLIASCALRRNESRGAHFMSDYPGQKEALLKDTII